MVMTERRRPWRAVIVGVMFALLIAAVAVLAVTVRDDRHRLHADEAKIAALGATQRDQGAAVDSSRRGLTALTGRVDGTDQRLQTDEKQLRLQQAQLPPDVTQIARRVAPSVVVLHCGGSLIGSGFAFDLPVQPGFGSVIVTAAHVVDACTTTGGPLTLSYNGVDVPTKLRGEGHFDLAAPVGTTDDVALLDVSPKIPPLEAATTDISVGDFVMVIGSPLFESFAGNVTTGIVSKVQPTYFLHSASEGPGNSGGPVVDRNGKVLGWVLGTYQQAENLNVATRPVTACRANLLGPSCPF
jgi:S1-C subfamily serine protease